MAVSRNRVINIAFRQLYVMWTFKTIGFSGNFHSTNHEIAGTIPGTSTILNVD